MLNRVQEAYADSFVPVPPLPVSQSHSSFYPILRRFAALGQGFAIGLEDVGAVAFLLPAGTRPEDVEGRLRVFQDVRKARAEFVARESIEQAIVPENRASSCAVGDVSSVVGKAF